MAGYLKINDLKLFQKGRPSSLFKKEINQSLLGLNSMLCSTTLKKKKKAGGEGRQRRTKVPRELVYSQSRTPETQDCHKICQSLQGFKRLFCFEFKEELRSEDLRLGHVQSSISSTSCPPFYCQVIFLKQYIT